LVAKGDYFKKDNDTYIDNGLTKQYFVVEDLVEIHGRSPIADETEGGGMTPNSDGK